MESCLACTAQVALLIQHPIAMSAYTVGFEHVDAHVTAKKHRGRHLRFIPFSNEPRVSFTSIRWCKYRG